jgi:predicted RNA binding protein YcfA (HicA-like mRNA interferase family)
MKQNGYVVDRTTGSHVIYKKDNDSISLPINKGGSKKIHKYTINSEFKKHNIIV